jgi:hypothetical protein
MGIALLLLYITFPLLYCTLLEKGWQSLTNDWQPFSSDSTPVAVCTLLRHERLFFWKGSLKIISTIKSKRKSMHQNMAR